MKIAVLGATGKTGRYLVARLCADGHHVTAIGRESARLARLEGIATWKIADLERPETVQPALAGAECVISLAHARFTETLLACLPTSCKRVVLTGSTRKFTELPDPAADAVRHAEKAFLASGQPGLMLHPSMIYGAPDDRNVNRILRFIRRWPRALPVCIPLPDGGRNFLQPVFVDDVVAAFAAAATQEVIPRSLILAGPEPISYAEMVRSCARALERRAIVVPIATRVLKRFATIGTTLRLSVPFNAVEIARAVEDKKFDITETMTSLGFQPRPFLEGVRLKVARGWY